MPPLFPSPPPPSPYSCPRAVPGRTTDRTLIFYNASNLAYAEAETVNLKFLETVPKVLPGNVSVLLRCNMSNTAVLNLTSFACVATGVKRVTGGELRPTALNGTELACSVSTPPVATIIRTPVRINVTQGDGLPPVEITVVQERSEMVITALALACVAVMEGNGTRHTVDEGVEPLVSFDPYSLTRCRLYDMAPTRLSNTTAVRCGATSTPSHVVVPPSATGYDTRLDCSRYLARPAQSTPQSLSAVLGSAEPLPTLAALLCPSSPCGQPAAAALELLQGFTRRANVDVDLKIYSPPPPQPPSRRVSPPPPPPPAPNSINWVSSFEDNSTFCLDVSLHTVPPSAFVPAPPPPPSPDAPASPAAPTAAAPPRSLSDLFSRAFGGFQPMPWPEAAVCTPEGYHPYRMSHLSVSGTGLTGALGVDILRDPMLLADGVPVSNLISIDLSNNSISGVLPGSGVDGAAAFRGVNFPALFWNLSRNAIGGPLPPYFYLHSALVVDLSYNQLYGPLPDNWTLLETVVELDLSGNQLNGTLPLSWATSLGPPSNLTTSRDYFAVRRRGLDERGSDPHQGADATHESTMRSVALNAFGLTASSSSSEAGSDGDPQRSRRHLTQIGTGTGSASPPPPSPPPPSLPARHRGMVSLRLAGNALSGPLHPEWLSLATQELDLSGNQLSGPVPADWGPVARMRSLDISGNAGLYGSVSGISWEDMLRVVKFSGTRVTVDPAALLDGRLPRRALWATIVDAALAGQLSLGNVQRPAVGIEDLSDICDIYRAYRSYQLQGEAAPTRNLHGVTDSLTLGRGLFAASQPPASQPPGPPPGNPDAPTEPMYGLMAEFARWASGGDQNDEDRTQWIARPEEWCYDRNVSLLLRPVLGLWLPVIAVLVAMLVPIPCYYYWQQRDEQLAADAREAEQHPDLVRVAASKPHVHTSGPSFAAKLMERLSSVAAARAQSSVATAPASVLRPGPGRRNKPTASVTEGRGVRFAGGEAGAAAVEGGQEAAAGGAVGLQQEESEPHGGARGAPKPPPSSATAIAAASPSAAAASRVASMFAAANRSRTASTGNLGGTSQSRLASAGPVAEAKEDGAAAAAAAAAGGKPPRGGLRALLAGSRTTTPSVAPAPPTVADGGNATAANGTPPAGTRKPMGRSSIMAAGSHGGGGSAGSVGSAGGSSASLPPAPIAPRANSLVAPGPAVPAPANGARADVTTPVRTLRDAAEIGEGGTGNRRTSLVIHAGPRLPLPELGSEPSSPHLGEGFAAGKKLKAGGGATSTAPSPAKQDSGTTAVAEGSKHAVQRVASRSQMLPVPDSSMPRPKSRGDLGLVHALQGGGSGSYGTMPLHGRSRGRRVSLSQPDQSQQQQQQQQLPSPAPTAASAASLAAAAAAAHLAQQQAAPSGPLAGLLGRPRGTTPELPPELQPERTGTGASVRTSSRLSNGDSHGSGTSSPALPAGAMGHPQGSLRREHSGRSTAEDEAAPSAAGIPAVAARTSGDAGEAGVSAAGGGGGDRPSAGRPGSGGRGSLAARNSAGAGSTASAEELCLPGFPAAGSTATAGTSRPMSPPTKAAPPPPPPSRRLPSARSTDALDNGSGSPVPLGKPPLPPPSRAPSIPPAPATTAPASALTPPAPLIIPPPLQPAAAASTPPSPGPSAAVAAAAAANAAAATRSVASTSSDEEDDARRFRAASFVRRSHSVSVATTPGGRSIGGNGSRRAWAPSRRGSEEGGHFSSAANVNAVAGSDIPPEPQLIAVGPPPAPPPKPKKQRVQRHPLEHVCFYYWLVWDFVGPRVGALLYLFSIATDAYFIGAYVSPRFSVAPMVVVGVILVLFFAVSWGIRLHVAWGASLRTAVLAAAFSFPLGMAYELGWDVVTAVFGFFLGSTESLNAAIRSVAYFCCNGRPGCFSLAANLRVFRIKLLLEPWLNALPQAVVQATFFMCSYRDGFIIPWTAYMLSAAASAASLLRAAAALHHYAYSGVPLREAFLQRGEHFNAELLRLDALEDMQDLEVAAKADPVSLVHRVMGLRAASMSTRVRIAPEDGISRRGTSVAPSAATSKAPSPQPSRPASAQTREQPQAAAAAGDLQVAEVAPAAAAAEPAEAGEKPAVHGRSRSTAALLKFLRGQSRSAVEKPSENDAAVAASGAGTPSAATAGGGGGGLDTSKLAAAASALASSGARGPSARSRSVTSGRLRFAAASSSARGAPTAPGVSGASVGGTEPGDDGPTGRYGNAIPKPSAPNAFFGSAEDRPEYHRVPHAMSFMGTAGAKSFANKWKSNTGRAVSARNAAEQAATAATLVASGAAGRPGAQASMYGSMPAGTQGAYGMLPYGGMAAMPAQMQVQMLQQQQQQQQMMLMMQQQQQQQTAMAANPYAMYGSVPVATMAAQYNPAAYQQYAAYYAAMQQQQQQQQMAMPPQPPQAAGGAEEQGQSTAEPAQ